MEKPLELRLGTESIADWNICFLTKAGRTCIKSCFGGTCPLFKGNKQITQAASTYLQKNQPNPTQPNLNQPTNQKNPQACWMEVLEEVHLGSIERNPSVSSVKILWVTDLNTTSPSAWFDLLLVNMLLGKWSELSDNNNIFFHLNQPTGFRWDKWRQCAYWFWKVSVNYHSLIQF